MRSLVLSALFTLTASFASNPSPSPCDLEAMATDASGEYSCGVRIEWLKSKYEVADSWAREQVAQQFPTICGLCSSPPEKKEEGLVLIRDSYQFGDAKLPMTGFTPDSDGPHKLIVLLGGNQPSDGTEQQVFEQHDRAFTFQRGAMGKAVATQGHGIVIVGYSGAENLYPDYAGATEFDEGDFSGSRAKGCAEWVRQGTGVIAGINKLCARDDFDCSSGIALTGYSQGAGVAVQTSKLYPGVNALMSLSWAPLFDAGNAMGEAGKVLLPPDPLALHWCGFDDTGNNPPTWSTVGNLASVPTDQYPPALSTFVDKTKRLSVISAQDHRFGNPTEDPAATAPVFSLQRNFSGYYDCPDSQNDCTQADGSGYYVIPAGVVPSYIPGERIHDLLPFAVLDDAFIGKKWHIDASFKWLGDAAFGAKA